MKRCWFKVSFVPNHADPWEELHLRTIHQCSVNLTTNGVGVAHKHYQRALTSEDLVLTPIVSQIDLLIAPFMPRRISSPPDAKFYSIGGQQPMTIEQDSADQSGSQVETGSWSNEEGVSQED